VIKGSGRGEFDAYVIQHLPRPVLKIGKRNDQESYRTYGFVDGVSDTRTRYGLHDQDLVEAYNKAGSAFRGQLSQNFIVLKSGLQGVRDSAVRSSGPSKTKRRK